MKKFTVFFLFALFVNFTSVNLLAQNMTNFDSSVKNKAISKTEQLQKQTKSAPITNNGIDDNAKDFRVEKNKQTKSFRKIFEKIKNYFR